MPTVKYKAQYVELMDKKSVLALGYICQILPDNNYSTKALKPTLRAIFYYFGGFYKLFESIFKQCLSNKPRKRASQFKYILVHVDA